MEICPTPIGSWVSPFGVHPAACKRELCEVCGKRRRWSFIRRTATLTHLAREFTITSPLLDPSRETLRWFNRKCAELKCYLDRVYGKHGRPVWSNELGKVGRRLHKHSILGDYGYVDFRSLRHEMIRLGLCSWVDGKPHAWRFKYKLLRNRGAAIHYVAAYVAKGAEAIWPKYARIRYTPVPEKRPKSPEIWTLLPGLPLGEAGAVAEIVRARVQTVRALGVCARHRFVQALRAIHVAVGSSSRQSALPCSTAQRAGAPEWGQMVADTGSRPAEHTLHPNRPLLSLSYIDVRQMDEEGVS